MIIKITKERKSSFDGVFQGHASQSEFKELIEKIRPKTIIPVHSEKPMLFESLFSGKVVLPKYAEPI